MIKYGNTVLIRNNSQLEGLSGVVIKVLSGQSADILLDKVVIVNVGLEDLVLVS